MTTTQSYAVLFPGQGSQYVGMGATLMEKYPSLHKTLKEASDVLSYDMIHLLTQGPEEILNQTDKTQPALLALSVAMWRLWKSVGGGVPQAMAGHSLGEYTALVCADALAFQDALKLVEARGQFMQNAVPMGVGQMAAVLGLDQASIEAVCEEVRGSQVLSCANLNCPGQIVIAGNREAVERFIPVATAKGAKRVIVLPVSVPSHCALMQTAADQLAELIARCTFHVPKTPVVANVDVTEYTHPDQIRVSLLRQLVYPVQWTQTIENLIQKGVTTFLECGPGKVLTGLTKRISSEVIVATLEDPDTFLTFLERMKT